MKPLDPQLAKLAADTLQKLAAENEEKTQKIAADAKIISSYERKEACQKLAVEIARREGIKDFEFVFDKAKEIEDSGDNLEVVAAGLKYASASGGTLGIVADRPSVGNPDEDLVAYILS